jgi:hypothetical protein
MTLEQLVAKAERIGVIGSPSSTNELALDIMASAVNKKLVGELAFFPYSQDAYTNYALGQITEITLRNIWHEDPTMRSLIRQRGRVDSISERQDTHQGQMIISAVFANENGNYRPSILGTVPATGTPIYLADDDILKELLKPYQSQLFYLGHVYGSKPKLPLWFKHFDSGQDGAGEAYHLGIFGKTGSGKSVLAKMILLAYMRHKKMGLFVLDPQGEFSLDLQNTQPTPTMGRVLHPTLVKGMGRTVEVYNLDKFRLDSWELFTELLTEFGFFFDLGIKAADYQNVAAAYLTDYFRESKKHKLSAIDDEALLSALSHLHQNVHRIYSGGAGIERVQGFIQETIQKSRDGQYIAVKEKWHNVAKFFAETGGKSSIEAIVKKALTAFSNNSRPVIVVDLSKRPSGISTGVWDEKIKPLLIDAFLGVLIREAEYSYQGEKSLNTLVVLDEAHRFAPQERDNNERKQRIKRNLVDAVRTTRKYGLGWMFLSQTLSSLDNEIVQQLRISFFGFGLSMGTEFRKLQELVGGKGEYLKLYQQFRDPHSSFDTASREYSFMTIGPVSPLSFSGTPLFFNAFSEVEEFIKSNGLITQGKML